MPFDPPKKHLDSIPAAEGQTRSLRGGAHLISSVAKGDKLISHITLRPDITIDGTAHTNDSHELAYYRKPEIKTSLENFGAIDGFASGKSTLDTSAQTKLKSMAAEITAYLHAHPNTNLSIVGFTDEAGFAGNKADKEKNARDNEKLSKDRAEATLLALTPLLDPDVRSRVVIGTEGQGARNPIEHSTVSEINRRVELRAISSVQREYHEIMHVPPAAYAAMTQKPFLLDFGLGEKTKSVYGQSSVEEAHASIIFELPRVPFAGDKVPRMQIVIDDPENVRLLVRAADGSMSKASVLQTDEAHLRLYNNSMLIAEVEIRGPEGQSRDLTKISLGIVSADGDISPIRGLSAGNALAESQQKSAQRSAALEEQASLPGNALHLPSKRFQGPSTNHR